MPLIRLKPRPAANVIKPFYDRELPIFIISWSVCPWRAFPAQSSVKGQTLQLITETVNYGSNKFMILAPSANVIKLFTTVSYEFS